MTAEGHVVFAITSTIIIKNLKLMPNITNIDWWHLLPIVILTSLLPDIDHPKSIVGQRLKWISKPIFNIFGHRGFTHSFLIVIFFWLLAYSKYLVIPYDVQQGIIIGYISHLAADILTPAGVPLFWPLRIYIRIPIINSNNKREYILCCLLIFFAFFISTDIFNLNKNFSSSNLILVFDTLKNFLIN